MKLTYKAIARAAGYRVGTTPTGAYYWYDMQNITQVSSLCIYEYQAYKDCCFMNQLVEEE